MSDLPPPSLPRGWYPDPESEGSERIWSGQAWTDIVRSTTPASEGAASKQPARPATPTPKKSIGCVGIGCLGIIGFVVIVIIIATISGATHGGSSGPNMDLAVVTCQDIVKDNLKAPATASFPRVPAVSGDTITGEVDSENSFGAKLRASFQCTVVSKTKVRLDYLR